MKKNDFSGIVKMFEKYKYLIIIILTGVFLLLLPNGEKQEVKSESAREDFSLEEFERKVERALSVCNGVGRCRVLLSVETSAERVYAKEARNSARENESGVMLENTSDTKPSVLSEGSGRESPLVVKEVYPSFRGAVIICEGAARADVRESITSSVMALTGLGADKISIVRMND